MAHAPGVDVLARRSGVLARALRTLCHAQRRIACVVRGHHQVDLRADGVVVVGGEVVAHAQQLGQAHDFKIEPHQVVEVDMAHAQLAQQRHHFLRLGGPVKLLVIALGGIQPLQADVVVFERRQGQRDGLLAQAVRQFVHMAQGAAACVVQHHQNAG
ncbi:hypothetical protein D3C72_1109940 [compost metagenome]